MNFKSRCVCYSRNGIIILCYLSNLFVRNQSQSENIKKIIRFLIFIFAKIWKYLYISCPSYPEFSRVIIFIYIAKRNRLQNIVCTQLNLFSITLSFSSKISLIILYLNFDKPTRRRNKFQM